MSSVTIAIPMLNEAKALPALAANLAKLDPPPQEVLCIDGGSEDDSVALAEAQGWRVISTERGRGRQINAGVEAACGEYVLILHADTVLPTDAVQVVETALADPKVSLASFTPIIRGPEKTRWGTTAHNWAKTWYAPLLFYPKLFFRGARLLFGDHAMFFRREQFLAVGGCDPQAMVMEEAELCIRLAALGRVRMVPRVVETSDRRIAEWGALKANWIYLKVGLSWALGAREGLERHYPDVR
tara:strand:+ start:277 stop:1002 length:726 start_codon:yes stop_codon:yes gene_type:complete